MINKKVFAVLLVTLAFISGLFAQTVKNKKHTTEFFPVSELKEGMKGTARTVFRGNEPEEFNVEIIGVVPGGIGPHQDLIVGRISGGSADRTSVFAGMSGSPVYIDGKLVGAISYSFPFSKEPICGITPIEQMVNIFEHQTDSESKIKSPRAVSFAELASTDWSPTFPSNAVVSSSVLVNTAVNSKMSTVAGQAFQPISTPITFSGFSQNTLDQFQNELLKVGLMPVMAAGGAAKMSPLKKADETTLIGGDSVTMHLTRGDFSMAASGTVTWRDGNKIYAFGHPFLNLGSADLPMSESSVVTVIPNLSNSFKLAVPESLVGSMTQDRNTGVFGNLGQNPKMIPVKLTTVNSRNQKETYIYEVAKDDFLTPLLLNMTVFNAMTAGERGLGVATVEVGGEIKIKNHDSIKFERRFGGMLALNMASGSVAAPANILLQSRFEDLEISGIELNLKTTDGSDTAVLERLALDKTQVRAGETVEIQAFVRNNSGKMFAQKIPVTIPKGTPTGTLMIAVGDGGQIMQNSVVQQFVPKDLSELIAKLNEVKKNDRLYVQTYRVSQGAVIGANELPNLPPSVLATLNNNRTVGGVKPTVETVVSEQEIPPADFLIFGKQILAIEVIK
jgi:hypothetical protein